MNNAPSDTNYTLLSGISINAAGINDGVRHFPWHDVKTCGISLGNDEDSIFGSNEQGNSVYILSLTRNDGTIHYITLEGVGEEKVKQIIEAINRHSGRILIEQKSSRMSETMTIIIIAIATIAVLVTTFLFT